MYCISSPIKRPQLSAETPSNRLMLPKKGKTIGYKPRLKFLIVAGHLSERTSQETSENGSLNTKANELKKKKHERKKQQIGQQKFFSTRFPVVKWRSQSVAKSPYYKNCTYMHN